MLIGFQYNRSPFDRSKRFSPSVANRIALIDSRLREAGMRLFVYSPQHVLPASGTVPGFLYGDGDFLPSTEEIPAVNGNWTHRTRRLLEQGMGYQEFGRWAQERGVGIFVPHAFSELLGNKLETYKLVRGFHETLHPHCEHYAGSERQLKHFVETGRITFIKPRSGSQGDRIITLRRQGSGLFVTHYRDGNREQYQATTILEAAEFVKRLTAGKKRYIIQHGIETARYDGSTFDIRVTMLHDGGSWHWLHEVRLSPEGSDVSNVKQGGRVVATDDLLFDLMGAEGSRQVLYELKGESFGLAAYLERLHPGDILEVALDFAIDREGRVRLLEINTKPGLAGIGSDVHLRDKLPEHEPLFEKWVYPHTRHLAGFLRTKAEKL